ncbi:hypothetical protein MRX96_034004 [Rhipicephalus microplus]
MYRGDNGACIIILPLPKSDCRSTSLGFAGGTDIDTLKMDASAIMGFRVESADDHIGILLVNAPAIMGFRIERDTVKFANSKGAVTITTVLWARWLTHNAVF